MRVETADFREQTCPDVDIVFTDPPFGLGKVYNGVKELETYDYWVNTLHDWAANHYGWLLVLGPWPTMREWLPLVPPPDDMIMWHRTFLLPKKGKAVRWADSLCPVLVYGQGRWNGTGRMNESTEHDLISAHSSMGDVTRLKKLGLTLKGHPGVTGTSFPRKVLPLISSPGDSLFDPMAGSGSILVAGLRAGLRVGGYETVPEWADMANCWLKGETEIMETGREPEQRPATTPEDPTK